jgi:quinol monooxygenase YgiN
MVGAFHDCNRMIKHTGESVGFFHWKGNTITYKPSIQEIKEYPRVMAYPRGIDPKGGKWILLDWKEATEWYRVKRQDYRKRRNADGPEELLENKVRGWREGFQDYRLAQKCLYETLWRMLENWTRAQMDGDPSLTTERKEEMMDQLERWFLEMVLKDRSEESSRYVKR